MRSPASSITALILPVRFRAVASGLMIENVRSVIDVRTLRPVGQGDGAYSGARSQRQGDGAIQLGLFFPARACPLAPRAPTAPLRAELRLSRSGLVDGAFVLALKNHDASIERAEVA